MSANPGRPVDVGAQVWIESSLQWFTDQFGARQLQAEVVLPTARFLPADYSAAPAEIEHLVAAACIRLQVDPRAIDLQLFDGSAEKEAARRANRKRAVGHFHMADGRAVVSLDLSEAADPQVLLAIVVHELCHVRLIGEGRISSARPDQERLTDLLTIFFGFGIFSTNGAMRFDRRSGYWIAPSGEFDDRTLNSASNTGYNRLGYLTSAEFGYALSCYAWLRKERQPEWARHVNPGPLHVMKRGLAYLAAAGKPGELPSLRMLNSSMQVGGGRVRVVSTPSGSSSFGMTAPAANIRLTGQDAPSQRRQDGS